VLLGSVTREILKKIEAPVCTIGPRCTPPAALRNIVHPTALEPDCENAVRLAVGLAQYHHAELTLLHVLPKDFGVEPYLDPQYAFEKMESLLPSSDGTPCRMVRTEVASGDMAAEVLRAAEKTHAGMIVLGLASGSSFWKGGTEQTAYSIVASAPCPVLSVLVPAHQAEKAADSSYDMRAVG
jgi:nucleotide-binding universal stress UspA family protein